MNSEPLPQPLSLNEKEDLNDHLSSLRYAGIIQRALLPDEAYLKSLLRDYFVLFLPRDIVSGDFYYALKVRNYLCVAVGDCTGHGVPGALLNIMGIGFLNDILQSKADLKANRILNTMREKLMKALHQTGEKTEAKDSIDLGLCIFDCTTHTLQFAGANRPLYRIRDGELTEFKADKMTIGVAPLIEESFTSQIVDYKSGDHYYMFSDGYADQFGEVTDKKFKIKSLKQAFIDIAGLSMNDQKRELEKTFNDWKGNTRQIDDVLIFGFQF